MTHSRAISKRTLLEKRRVKAARITILVALVFFAVLALWQCAESSETGGRFSCLTNPGETREPSPGLTADPLTLKQEGILFMDMNANGGILWYQSIWDVSQSRVLLERALTHKGWLVISEEDEPIMSFIYAPGGRANGASLLVSLYPLEEGCSILIELL